jgi:hypothetical protein
MDRAQVQSSSLRSVGFDPNEKVLEVEFQSGGVYQYFGVPEAIFRELMLASSKGAFFNRRIADHFPYKRIDI